jgi:type II secretory pathway component GspD/PulD (secretin)
MSGVFSMGLGSINRHRFTWLARRFLITGLVIASVAVPLQPLHAADQVPWDASKLFEWTANDEDIKSVLRRVISLNGQQSAFTPGVEGTVSFTMSDMPVQAAFNKLLSEQQLGFKFDEKNNLVTVFPLKSSIRAKAFVPLAQATPGSVMKAVRDFGLGGEISFDNLTNTALLEGSPEEVSALESIVERLDQAAISRKKADIQRKTMREAENEVQASSDLLEKMSNQDVKVIRLRYASVASTTKTFQGQTVSVPGIEESIGNLLGGDADLRESLPPEYQKTYDELATSSLTDVFLSTDPRTNSVIVRGTPDQIANVEQMVKKLDLPVPLIQIDVMIVNAVKGITKNLGVDWAQENNNVGDGVTSQNAGFDTGVSGGDPFSAASTSKTTLGGLEGAAAGAAAVIGSTNSIVAGLIISGADSALQIQLSALEDDNKTQTIAAPTLVTTNNVIAKVGRTASQFMTLTAGNATSIEEVDVGLDFSVIPSIIPSSKQGEQDMIRLVLNARNTAIGSTSGTTVNTTGQEMQSEVIIPNGRTFMMGGLADDSRTDNNSGVSFLKDLPIIGKLFETNDSTDDFEETIFFVTAKIVYPENILQRDIASRQYIKSRQFDLSESRKELQRDSNVLSSRIAYQEEDE